YFLSVPCQFAANFTSNHDVLTGRRRSPLRTSGGGIRRAKSRAMPSCGSQRFRSEEPAMSADTYKREAAARAVGLIEPKMKVGLGTGSTAAHLVELLGARVKSGLDVV